jgi:alkylation response protein AidB-like acyl-CoA dehydrogenase
MQFGLNESQEILKQNARQFFGGECPMTHVRHLAENKQPYDPALWSKMAAQGYMGIIFPEKYDGLGLGTVELILLMEEAGRALLPGPFWSTVAVAGGVIDAVASDAQKMRYLAPICRGEARSTLALLETGATWDLADVKLSVSGGKLSGEKLFVLDADVADFILVAAKSGVFLVEARAPGLSITPMPALDLTRNFYAVQFKDTPAEKLGTRTNLARALDIATSALVAEMAGGMQRVLDLTVDYAKMRKQFGKPIGTFQAVQHKCADMYLETESSRSAAYYAAWALEHDAPDAATATSIAKMYASDACRSVGNRGIQIHGGNGFAWENDIHLYYRRAKASETMLGDATFHRERIARLVVDSVSTAGCSNDRSSR